MKRLFAHALALTIALLISYSATTLANTAPNGGLYNPVLYQRNPADGLCGTSTNIFFANYPANRQGLPTSFDAVFDASTVGVGGRVVFGIWERETGISIPPNRSTSTYTVTMDFPQGIGLAPLYMYIDGEPCLPHFKTPRTNPSMLPSVTLSELYIVIRASD